MIVRYQDRDLKLPEDRVVGFHRNGRDLYVVYTRSVLRIADFEHGNDTPEEAYTLEMADYYSYEDPIMFNDQYGNLWCHIGGRLFAWETSKSRWIENAQFSVDSLLRVDGDLFVFRNHLQYDDDPNGLKSYNYVTKQLTTN